MAKVYIRGDDCDMHKRHIVEGWWVKRRKDEEAVMRKRCESDHKINQTSRVSYIQSVASDNMIIRSTRAEWGLRKRLRNKALKFSWHHEIIATVSVLRHWARLKGNSWGCQCSQDGDSRLYIKKIGSVWKERNCT